MTVRLLAPLAAVVALGACAATPRPRPVADGLVTGLARDHDSGDPVAHAKIHLTRPGLAKPFVTTSDDHGVYKLAPIPPGTYRLSAMFAGQPIEVDNVVVNAGQPSFVDVVFTLGMPDAQHYDYNDRAAEISRYRPRDLSDSVSVIEGTVSDAGTRERIPGAVVTAVADERTEQTISDEHGRYRFDAVAPGTYAVSAYYSIGGRAQIEVRRSEIAVAGAEAVVVPLWIELAR